MSENAYISQCCDLVHVEHCIATQLFQGDWLKQNEFPHVVSLLPWETIYPGQLGNHRDMT